MEDSPVKLHIGCGATYLRGYINIDAYDSTVADIVATANNLPFPDNSADLIESHHLVEHLSYEEFRVTIKEWYRTLKYGGKLFIECPDLIENLKIFLSSDYKKRWLWYKEEFPHGRIAAFFGNQFHQGQFHKNGFDKERITEVLSEFGFINVTCHAAFGTPEIGENLIVEAYKPFLDHEGFSLILPTYSAIDELDLCLKSIERNSRLKHELIIIVDGSRDAGFVNFDILNVLNDHRLSFNISYFVNHGNLGPYRNWNTGAQMASRNVVAFITDDQYFAPDWDINISKHLSPDKMLTAQLVEPGLIGVWPSNLEFNCGEHAKNFDEEKFLQFANANSHHEIIPGGFYIPLVMHKDVFLKIGGFPSMGSFGIVDAEGNHLAYPNDVLFHKAAEEKGVFLYQVKDSFSYHFQGSSWMKKDK